MQQPVPTPSELGGSSCCPGRSSFYYLCQKQDKVMVSVVFIFQQMDVLPDCVDCPDYLNSQHLDSFIKNQWKCLIVSVIRELHFRLADIFDGFG